MIEIVDMRGVGRLNRRLLREAQRVFWNARTVVTPTKHEASHVLDSMGNLVALAWVDDTNRIRFHSLEGAAN